MSKGGWKKLLMRIVQKKRARMACERSGLSERALFLRTIWNKRFSRFLLALTDFAERYML